MNVHSLIDHIRDIPSLKNTKVPMAVDPKDEDILCGANRTARNHPGNMRFHSAVANKFEEYNEADTKAKKVKVTVQAYREVTTQGGRFLKKHPIFDLWYVARNQKRVGRDKISHFLRMMGRKTDGALRHRWDSARNYQAYHSHDEGHGRLHQQDTEKPPLQGTHEPSFGLPRDIMFYDQSLMQYSLSQNVSMRASCVLSEGFHIRTIEEMMNDSSHCIAFDDLQKAPEPSLSMPLHQNASVRALGLHVHGAKRTN